MRLKQKRLWIDTETTGVHCQENAIIQIACVVEIDGALKDEFSINMKPRDGAVVCSEALEANGRTRKEIDGYQDSFKGLQQFQKRLQRYVNKYDKKDKFVPAGYNVLFDTDFLRQHFIAHGDNYYGSWFFTCAYDVMTLVAEDVMYGNRYENHKLGTVCTANGVPLENAHDAMSDIHATILLHEVLKKKLSLSDIL